MTDLSIISRRKIANGFVIERPEREEIDFALLVFVLVVVLDRFIKSEDEDDDENENAKNKKAFIPAKQRMKALSESRSAHTERAGLILLLTEKLTGKVQSLMSNVRSRRMTLDFRL
jgi:hypothetical protein